MNIQTYAMSGTERWSFSETIKAFLEWNNSLGERSDNVLDTLESYEVNGRDHNARETMDSRYCSWRLISETLTDVDKISNTLFTDVYCPSPGTKFTRSKLLGYT